MLRLNNTLLNDQRIVKKNEKEIKIFLESNENESHNLPESLGQGKYTAKGKFYCYECPHLKIRQSSK
jgi:hypothetical protein